MKVKVFWIDSNQGDTSFEKTVNEFLKEVNVVHICQSPCGTLSAVCFSIWYDEATTSADTEKLFREPAEILGLSARPYKALVTKASLVTIRQICAKTDSDLLKYRNFGKKSLREIKEKLAALGLQTGMDVS